jgi:hypothetical protein
MEFHVPLFGFGLFIALLVAIGVVLACTEFRQAHTPRMPQEERSSAPKS